MSGSPEDTFLDQLLREGADYELQRAARSYTCPPTRLYELGQPRPAPETVYDRLMELQAASQRATRLPLPIEASSVFVNRETHAHLQMFGSRPERS